MFRQSTPSRSRFRPDTICPYATSWAAAISARTRAHAALTTVAITVAAVVLVVLEGDEREHLHNHAIQHVWRRKLIRFEWTIIDVMLDPDSMWV